MRLTGPGGGHLTYCSNIHPGESWPEVRAILDHAVPLVRDAVAAGQPFGVGLRLSAAAAEALMEPDALADLRALMTANGFYVFTLNGFPYGAFHGVGVKEHVYRPDWREPARLAYTRHLADLLAALLPDDPELTGSISTVPGAYKPRCAHQAAAAAIAENLLRAAAHLAALERESGRSIALALEPEPCCFLETIAETVAFFEAHLFNRTACERLAALAGLSVADAEAATRRHLGLCLDTCHAAVEFEDAAAAIASLRAAGIAIAKLQLSSALIVRPVCREAMDALQAFADPVYLHQVVERSPAGLRRFTDLPEAMAGFIANPDGNEEREWRIHFHVPIFRRDLPPFTSTQAFLEDILALHRAAPISPHLEVETYTWSVLPTAYRGDDMTAAIARELAWVRDRLAA
jgi:sugar phosphate isomerase/epimerase